MITHNLAQGSQDWLIHRAQYKNASDSPVVMGESKYKTRSQFLAECHSGIAPDVDAGTQRLFDDGHRFEALARPLAEKIIGEGLSPITGTEGEFGASFDGITFGGEIIWEHKSLNDEIRPVTFGDNLPLMYRIQMEHQLMVSGAGRCLFSATKWNSDDVPVEEIHVWYVPDLELRARIIAAWGQFDKDLAAYRPEPETIQAVAAPIMQLPALSIQIKGKVTLSNLPQFREAAEQFIANIKTDLVTDDDFADAEATVKFCDAAEKNLEQAKIAAIAQTASIDKLMRTIDHIKGQLSTKRLILIKLIESEKQSRKGAIVADAQHEYLNHLDELYKEIKPIELQVKRPDFAGAMKGLKKLSAMEEAVGTALRNGMFEADLAAKEIRAKLAWFREFAAYEFLFRDLNQVIQKPMEDFRLIATSRIEAHKTAEEVKLEAERQRIQADEEKKARAKIEQEQRAVVAGKEVAVAQEQLAKVLAPDPAAPDHIASAGKVIRRPSDRDIIRALCIDFSVSESVVVGWLKDIDLSIVEAA